MLFECFDAVAQAVWINVRQLATMHFSAFVVFEEFINIEVDLSEADFEQLAQDGVPMIEMDKGADLMQALVDSELQPSRGQARKTIASNAVTINGEKQSDPEYFFQESDILFGRYTLLRRGKKNYCLICWK